LGYTSRVTHTRVAVRPAQKADLAVIVRLFAEDELLGSRSSAARGGVPGEAEAERQPPARAVSDAHVVAFEAIARDPNNAVYVAEVGARVVGTFQLTFIRQLSYGGCLVAQVESVFVEASARSLGVGATMMDFARQEAERRGALRLQLTSNLERERAHRFYEKLGYQATHKGMKLYLQPSRKAER
jgi:GNAT superfamily N-acetyltransferase